MEGKLRLATSICEQAAPATGKGAAGIRDELGQDSAEPSWIQLPLQEGRGGRDRGPAVPGGQLLSTTTSAASTPSSCQVVPFFWCS